MRISRFPALATLAVALALVSSLAAGARADVLDMVPADAMVVIKIKSLEGLSKKVAKFSADAGFDQVTPELADGLTALAGSAKIEKGLKRDGDFAAAILDPDKFPDGGRRAVLVLVPTTDFKTFLTNFNAPVDEGGGIYRVTPSAGPAVAFVAERGAYAAVSMSKAILSAKATGLKLTGLSGKENESKDAIVFANIKVLREKSRPQLKLLRENLLGAAANNADPARPGRLDEVLRGNPRFVPLAKAALGQLFNVAEQFLNDAHSATLGLSVTEAGVTATVQADFDPTSYTGKMVLETKGTDASLVAGLPDRKYFFYAGGTNDPKTSAKLAADLLDPVIKELAALDDTKRLATSLEGMKATYGATKGWAVGYVAPAAKVELGKESLVQQVAVIRGDAAAIRKSQRQAMEGMNDLFALMPQQNGMTAKFEYKEGAKQVAGMSFDAFRTTLDFPADDVEAQRAKQTMLYIYGPDGMSGILGAIDENTVLALQGGSDELVNDAYAAAKANADTLGALAGVRATAAELPKVRSVAAFVDVGTIVNTALRYLKSVSPIDVKGPADLPPIGMTAGVEGTSVRMDVHVPAKLVQGLVETYAKIEAARRDPSGGI